MKYAMSASSLWPCRRRSSLLGKDSFPPPPVLPAGSHGVAYARASEKSSGVLSSEMPQATLGTPVLESHIRHVQVEPLPPEALSKPGGPKDGLPLGATEAHQNV